MAQGRVVNPNRNSIGSQRRWWAGPATFMAAMLAAPAGSHFHLPDESLMAAARVAPNIL